MIESELEEYLQNHFTARLSESDIPDDSFLHAWTPVFQSAQSDGVATALNTFLCPKLPVTFKNPDKITIELYNATAGQIPVIFIPNVDDFETFTTNTIHKGIRPQNIGVTGASFVFGKSNRFIILSNKPYSNVSAKTMGLDEESWHEKSMKIRLEHECTHFWTKKYYGVAKNHIHDELIADFFGILAAFGEYKAEYFEYFIGCKGTEGNRVLAYVPENSSPDFINALKQRAVIFAQYFEEISKTSEFLSKSKESQIEFLCNLNLNMIK